MNWKPIETIPDAGHICIGIYFTSSKEGRKFSKRSFLIANSYVILPKFGGYLYTRPVSFLLEQYKGGFWAYLEEPENLPEDLLGEPVEIDSVPDKLIGRF